MKQLREVSRKKIIALLADIDVDNITTREIFTDLRNRGFKPPHGKYWTEKKLMEVLEVPEVPPPITKICPLCRQEIWIDSRICPECWTKI